MTLGAGATSYFLGSVYSFLSGSIVNGETEYVEKYCSLDILDENPLVDVK